MELNRHKWAGRKESLIVQAHNSPAWAKKLGRPGSSLPSCPHPDAVPHAHRYFLWIGRWKLRPMNQLYGNQMGFLLWNLRLSEEIGLQQVGSMRCLLIIGKAFVWLWQVTRSFDCSGFVLQRQVISWVNLTSRVHFHLLFQISISLFSTIPATMPTVYLLCSCSTVSNCESRGCIPSLSGNP